MKRCVIVGYGGMGSWHARHIMERGAVELAGVFDIKEERVASAKEKGIYTYPSFEAVLADESVDLVTIATPNELHKPLAIAALRAGKHVISEKPVTLSSADLAEKIESSIFCETLPEVTQQLRDIVKEGDVVITMGAGDIFRAGEALLKG